MPVFRYTLRNNRGMSVQIITYGATVQTINVPDRFGRTADVVLGFKTLADYVNFDSPPVAPTTGVYFGETVGRYANRIANGKFTLNQPGVGPVNYTIPVNNGPNALHGGIVGFGNHVWADKPVFGPRLRGRAAHAGQPERRRGLPRRVSRLPERLHRLSSPDQGRPDLHPEQRQPAGPALHDHQPVQGTSTRSST